jgi:adenylate kinase
MSLYIVLLGPPGAGKGTQARTVSNEFGIPVVSTGDMFRAMKTLDTPLARQVQEIMARGDLVPDDITVQMVKERFEEPDCQNGAMLDGFPRTEAQAEALDEMLAESFDEGLSGVPFFDLSKEEAVRRISGRRMCRANDHPYHVEFNPPQQEGVCDIDGSELYQRKDDTPEAVEQRYVEYVAKTAPLVEFYRDRGLLFEIDASQAIDQITEVLRAEVRRWQTKDEDKA